MDAQKFLFQQKTTLNCGDHETLTVIVVPRPLTIYHDHSSVITVIVTAIAVTKTMFDSFYNITKTQDFNPKFAF